ncbi:hypothetical protein [Hymenobacter sp. B1770]|uniref:hypothetical protein n=1 Tax=Hymenobacter sp. B1770 TaxID=1718788 RepID=UPI003CEA608C
MKLTHYLLAASLVLSASAASAQDDGKGKDKDKYKKENKDKDYKDRNDRYKDKDYKEKEYKDRDKDDDRYKNGKNGRYDDRNSRTTGGVGGVLGRVILPRAGTAGPRELAGVPRGHYPPPGECRVWYPNRPPGHQPPPTSCDRLAGVRLEPGAFILHGDRAYDAEYNWREEDRRRPGTVGRDILDILFPRR